MTSSRLTGKDHLGLYLLITAPFIALSAISGLVNGCRYVWANGYFEQNLTYLGAQCVRAQVNRDLWFAVLCSSAIFAIAFPFLRRGWSVGAFVRYAYTLELLALATRGLFSKEWWVISVRYGAPLPSLFWHKELLIRMGIALIVCLALVSMFHWYRARRCRDQELAGAAPRYRPRVPVRSCIGLLVLAVVVVGGTNLRAALTRPEQRANSYNVVYITWDSVRADHLSCYGYSRLTSPHLDAFARDTVLFENAISQYNWTRPSYASIFTSLHCYDLSWGIDLRSLTLAEVLKNNGYRTHAFVNNPNLESEFHFEQGFDSYWQIGHGSAAEDYNDLVLERIESLARSEEPFFLFVHYNEAHYPYRLDNRFAKDFVRSPGLMDSKSISNVMHSHGASWDPASGHAEQEVDYLLDLYDASIRSADEAFGQVIAALENNGVLDDTLVIFNSDHGDEFNDRGAFGHGHANLYPELTYVPLVVRYPKQMRIRPERISTPVQNLDIAPTVLEVVGIAAPPEFTGRSLLSVTRRDTPERVAFSSISKLVCVRSPRHALFVDYGGEPPPLCYDIQADPRETKPLSDAEKIPAYGEMKTQADHWFAIYQSGGIAESSGETMEFSDDLRQRLKSLGYVGDD